MFIFSALVASSQGSGIFDDIPSGDVNTFYDHVMNAGPSLHGGNPLSFFIENQKEYIETVADRGRWRRDESHAHHDMDSMPMDGLVPTNHIDAMGMCPHDVGGDSWDYTAHEDVTITDRSVILTDSITVNHLVIGNGGRLIFGEPSSDEIMLRALSITVEDGGEFWIGSRSCRYEHNAVVSLYGDDFAMERQGVGKKFVHCGSGSTCEFHGQERTAWTFLDEHLLRLNSVVEPQTFDFTDTPTNEDAVNVWPGIQVHRFSKFGAWKDSKNFNFRWKQKFPEYFSEENFECAEGDFNCEGDITIIFSIGMWQPGKWWKDSWSVDDLPEDVADIIGKYTNFYEQVADGADPTNCQFITIQDTNGNIEKFSCDQINGPMTFDLDLQGTQSGNQISVTLDLAAPRTNLKTAVRASVTYNPSSTDAPIITLADGVDWNAGDEIVVGSTDFNADNTEVFTVVDCNGECASNQVKLDRMASNTHFGRIDERTGIDQRAAVGLLTRNVRFQGEVGTECQYAQSRASLSSVTGDTATEDLCSHFDEDMHGGHFIVTRGFNSVHVSHIELTKMGQQTLGRYPLHWHMCGDIGPDVYEDPSSFESNSIHNCFHHFVTVHGTNNALVKGNVGYKTRGHGYFIEDGSEEGTQFIGNLGLVLYEGAVLPSEKGSALCEKAKEGFNGQVFQDACKGFSMFWISNTNTVLDYNVAVGGRKCYWILHHNGQTRNFGGRNLVHPPKAWIGNRASACANGINQDGGIEDREPEVGRKEPRFGISSMSSAASVEGDALKGCYTVEFDGWIIHHVQLGVWMRQGEVVWRNGQFADTNQHFIWATSQCPGSHQQLRDSTLVGFSENFGDSNGAYHTSNLNKRGGLGRGIWNGPVIEEVGGTGESVQHIKCPDGAYRQQRAFSDKFPTRAHTLYDSYIHTEFFNNKYFDYPNSEDRFTSAFGAKMGNKFGMTNFGTKCYNNQFTNVYRRMFMGTLGSGGLKQFGTNDFGEKVKADGEATTVVWDVTGDISGVEDSMIIAPENVAILTDDCTWNEIMLAYVCPRDGRRTISGKVKGFETHELGSNQRFDVDFYKIQVQNNDKFGEDGLIMRGAIERNAQYKPNFFANESYHISWPDSTPHEYVQWGAFEIDQGDWIKVSYCLQGADLKSFEQLEYAPTSFGGRDLRSPTGDRQTMIEVENSDVMDETNDRSSWFYDGQWLHIKTVGEYERSEAGTVKSTLGTNEMIDFGVNEWRNCHKAFGCPGASFIIDASTANSQSCSTNPNSKSTNPFFAENQSEGEPEAISDDGPEEDTEITVEIIEELVAVITPYQRCIDPKKMTEAKVSSKIPVWIDSRRKPFVKHIKKFLGPNKIAQKKWCPAGYGEPDQWKLSRWTDKKTMAAKMADLADPETLALIAEDIITVGWQDCNAHVTWAKQARQKMENWLMDWYVNLFGALDENGVRQESNSWLSKLHCSEI